MIDLTGYVAVVVRVATPGHVAFQLRKGEEGLSVFDPTAVEPPLSEDKILSAFREGSLVVIRPKSEITALGMLVESIDGGETLPDRLRSSHCEIRPAGGMTRGEFKSALRRLE